MVPAKWAVSDAARRAGGFAAVTALPGEFPAGVDRFQGPWCRIPTRGFDALHRPPTEPTAISMRPTNPWMTSNPTGTAGTIVCSRQSRSTHHAGRTRLRALDMDISGASDPRLAIPTRSCPSGAVMVAVTDSTTSVGDVPHPGLLRSPESGSASCVAGVVRGDGEHAHANVVGVEPEIRSMSPAGGHH